MKLCLQVREGNFMELHQRGVDLLVNVMDALDNCDQLTPADIRRLLTEVVDVISLVLERDAQAVSGRGAHRTTNRRS